MKEVVVRKRCRCLTKKKKEEVSINAQDIENYGFGGGRNGDTVAKFDGGNIYLGNDGGS